MARAAFRVGAAMQLPPRERVIAVIKDVADGVRANRHVHAPADPERLEELIRVACARVMISRPAYGAAIEEDPTLAKLEHDAIRQALADLPDGADDDVIPTDVSPHSEARR
jgi:hypothetical protein